MEAFLFLSEVAFLGTYRVLGKHVAKFHVAMETCDMFPWRYSLTFFKNILSNEDFWKFQGEQNSQELHFIITSPVWGLLDAPWDASSSGE